MEKLYPRILLMTDKKSKQIQSSNTYLNYVVKNLLVHKIDF